MDELRQVKDSVYRKPPPKKMPRKSGIVMKEHIPVVDYDKHDFSKEVKELKEKMDTATSVKAPWNNKSEEKEFGTHSSTRSRHDKKLLSTDITMDSDFVANPDLNRPTRPRVKVKTSDLADLVNRSFLRGVLAGCLIGCLLGGLIAMAVMV